jgi:hypothetical protein
MRNSRPASAQMSSDAGLDLVSLASQNNHLVSSPHILEHRYFAYLKVCTCIVDMQRVLSLEFGAPSRIVEGETSIEAQSVSCPGQP